MKHAHHDFDIDKPGKDSYEHRAAGAREVMVTATRRWALMHEHHGEAESTLEEMVARMSPVDLLLIEGFKDHAHEKLEIHRRARGAPLLAPEDDHVVAVASDEALPDLRVPVLDLDDVAGIADFILDRCGLNVRGGARGAA
jgi:molybdopterin-guanine dinucleotide biosynthesis protein B